MNPIRKAIVGAALVGTTLAGGAIGAVLVGAAATAATSSTTTPANSSTAAGSAAATPMAAPDPSRGGHVANGVTEVLLTGDTADKVKAAALAAAPDATIQRVENDAEGATYEAHMTKADGSQITVKLDASFKVTSIDVGMR